MNEKNEAEQLSDAVFLVISDGPVQPDTCFQSSVASRRGGRAGEMAQEKTHSGDVTGLLIAADSRWFSYLSQVWVFFKREVSV